MNKDQTLKNIKFISTTVIGILNRQIDKISPSGDNDDKYKIVGGKYPVSISRHAFIYVLVIVTSLSLCITLFALNKVLRIEKNETGILPAVPVGHTYKAESGTAFEFSTEAVKSRYASAFYTFNQELYRETINIVDGCSKSPICYIIATYQYITDNFICEKDIPVGSRPLKKPIETWVDRKGSSEDLSVLLSAMAYAFGYEISVCAAPNEAFASFQNFNEDELFDTIYDKYRDALAYIKKTTIELGKDQEYEIQITDDFRYSPLTMEISATKPVNLSSAFAEKSNAINKRNIITFWETELLKNGTHFNNDIHTGTNTKLIITGTQDNTLVTFRGYREKDKKVTEYIKEIININRYNSQGNYNQFGLFFGLEKFSIPGRESKYISEMWGTGIIVEVTADLMSKRFLKQDNSFTQKDPW